MTLTQLEHVWHAHRAGSFSRAARLCGVTQAALSNSIAKLEEELGERIFSRTTRSVTLSPFGESLIAYVEQILNGRDGVLALAKSGKLASTTTIGYSPLIPQRILTQFVGKLRETRGDLEIRLIEENLVDLLRRLGEHTVDVALLPEGDYATSLRSAALGQEPLYYVPRRSIEQKSSEVVLEHLATDRFVMVPDRCGLARRTRALFSSAGIPLQVYAGEAMGYHVLQEWADLDFGSAILPESRLTSGARAVPLFEAPGAPALLTYNVVWHSEYPRGKELAEVARSFPLSRDASPKRG